MQIDKTLDISAKAADRMAWLLACSTTDLRRDAARIPSLAENSATLEAQNDRCVAEIDCADAYNLFLTSFYQTS